MTDLQSRDGVLTPCALTHMMELKPYIEEPLSNDAPSINFISVDLRPRIRHDFVLSTRDAVDEYWQTLEYCYAAADHKAASFAFPGSVVPEVILKSPMNNWDLLSELILRRKIEFEACLVKSFYLFIYLIYLFFLYSSWWPNFNFSNPKIDKTRALPFGISWQVFL